MNSRNRGADEIFTFLNIQYSEKPVHSVDGKYIILGARWAPTSSPDGALEGPPDGPRTDPRMDPLADFVLRIFQVLTQG